jgi:hypothetical protein
MSATRTQQEIQKHLQAIEELRLNGLTQDVIEVLQNKKHTREELYAVFKAWTGDYEKTMRQNNLIKARAERKNKSETEPTTPE